MTTYTSPPKPVFETTSEAPKSGLAIASLVLGILGWLQVLPLLGSVLAIVTGHMARAEIARSEGRVGGKGLATAGLALGYSFLLVLVLVAFFAGMALLLYVGAATHVDFGVDPVKRALEELPVTATVPEKVITVVREQLGLAEEDVTLESTFEDLGVDDLDLVEIVMELEESLDITCGEMEIEAVKSVADLVALVERKLAEVPERDEMRVAPAPGQGPMPPPPTGPEP